MYTGVILLLMLSMLKKLSIQQFKIFFYYFSQKLSFDISCKLFPQETMCMKCQSLVSEKNKKNIINYLSAEFVKRVLKVIVLTYTCILTIIFYSIKAFPASNF